MNLTRDSLGNEIEKIETSFNESIQEVTEFLDSQQNIDYAKLRQQAMQKVHKEELIEQQQHQQRNNTKLKKPLLILT